MTSSGLFGICICHPINNVTPQKDKRASRGAERELQLKTFIGTKKFTLN